jgi:type I restriction enzyme S subunit
MSKYKPYPAYKETGIEWLGEVPEHWSIKRNKQCFYIHKTLVGNRHKDFQLLSLTLEGIKRRDIESGKGKMPAEFDTYQKVEANDLIFCLFDIDETPRTIGLSEFNGMITGAYAVAKIIKSSFSKYFYYYYLAIDYRKGLKPFYTGLRKVVRPETFMNIKVHCPSYDEQKAIANFLDRETQKIDMLIEKQQKLIELLKEKRQAVISHAVTKGLSPNAPMKDSGIEWLGEIPEHWEVVKCGYLGKLFGSESISEESINDIGDIPFIKVSSLSLDSFEIAEKQFFVDSSSVSVTRAKSNYVVFPKRGAAIFTNKVNIVNEKSFIDPNLMGWELVNRVQPEYVAHLLKLRGLSDIADVSTVPQINNKHIEPMKFPIPSIDEQRQIVENLKTQTQKIDTLIDKSQQAIELLKERKTALISAAVTGKIDVRGIA